MPRKHKTKVSRKNNWSDSESSIKKDIKNDTINVKRSINIESSKIGDNGYEVANDPLTDSHKIKIEKVDSLDNSFTENINFESTVTSYNGTVSPPRTKKFKKACSSRNARLLSSTKKELLYTNVKEKSNISKYGNQSRSTSFTDNDENRPCTSKTEMKLQLSKIYNGISLSNAATANKNRISKLSGKQLYLNPFITLEKLPEALMKKLNSSTRTINIKSLKNNINDIHTELRTTVNQTCNLFENELLKGHKHRHLKKKHTSANNKLGLAKNTKGLLQNEIALPAKVNAINIEKQKHKIRRNVLKRDYNYGEVLFTKPAKKYFKYKTETTNMLLKLTSTNDIFRGSVLGEGLNSNDYCETALSAVLRENRKEDTPNISVKRNIHTVDSATINNPILDSNLDRHDEILENRKHDKTASPEVKSKPKHTFKFPMLNVMKRPPTRNIQRVKLNKPIIKYPIADTHSGASRNLVNRTETKKPYADFDCISLYAESILCPTENASPPKYINNDTDSEDESEELDVLTTTIALDNPLCPQNRNGIDVDKWVENATSGTQELPVPITNITGSENISSVYEREDVSQMLTDPADGDEELPSVDTEIIPEEQPIIMQKIEMQQCDMPNISHLPLARSNSPLNKYPSCSSSKSRTNSPVNIYTTISPTKSRSSGSQKSVNQGNNTFESQSFSPCISGSNKVPFSPQLDMPEDVFYNLCPTIKSGSNCQLQACTFDHTLPPDWENTLLKLPVNRLNNFYDVVKRENYLYIYRKMFPIITQQWGAQKDFNNMLQLVKDILTINIHSDRAPYIDQIIKELCKIGLKFQSAVELIFKSTCVDESLTELLADILLNLTVENRQLDQDWLTVQMLLYHKKNNLDYGVVQNIMSETFKQTELNADLCRKVLHDLILPISDRNLSNISSPVLLQSFSSLEKVGLTSEVSALRMRCRSLDIRGFGSYNSHPSSPTNTLTPLYNSSEKKNMTPPMLNNSNLVRRSAPSVGPYQQPSYRTVTQFHIVNKVQNTYGRNVPAGGSGAPWYNRSKSVPASTLYEPYNNTHNQPPRLLDLDITPPSEDLIKRAIYAESVTQITNFIEKFQDNHMLEDFLRKCIKAMQETPHNFPTFFNNMCTNAIVMGDLHKNNPRMKYVLKTFGVNIIVHLVRLQKWDPASIVLKKLNSLFNDDILDAKIFLNGNYSVRRLVLIFCDIYIRKTYFSKAWGMIREYFIQRIQFHDQSWESSEVQYGQTVLHSLMSAMTMDKWAIFGLKIITYFLKHDIDVIDMTLYTDRILCVAINNNCHVSNIMNFVDSNIFWYNYVKESTFRAILVHTCKSGDLDVPARLFKRGIELSYYPLLTGNEDFIEIPVYYVMEEINLLFEILFQNMMKYFPRKCHLVIRIRESADAPLHYEFSPRCITYQNNNTPKMMGVNINYLIQDTNQS